MDERKQHILKLVIENYIQTAEPVGSKLLVELGQLEVSGATIRNELSDLEEAGYLTHPHTSAGRIPTELGYKYYVDNLLEKHQIGKNFQEVADEMKEKMKKGEAMIKELGKMSAAFSQNAVIVAFGKDRIYYTGMSYLFAQPEFSDVSHTIRISSIFDHCEEHVPELYTQIPEKNEKVFIGSENPLGSVCSTIAVRMDDEFLFAVLGPMRMDYKKNIALVQYIKSLF